jgi:hypothetical protein
MSSPPTGSKPVVVGMRTSGTEEYGDESESTATDSKLIGSGTAGRRAI